MGLVNNLARSLFKQIKGRLKGTLLNSQTDTYHYKAFIETIMNHDWNDERTILVPGTTAWMFLTMETPTNTHPTYIVDNATPHKDNNALCADKKSFGRQLNSVAGWKENDTEAVTLPGSVLSQKPTNSRYPDSNRDVLQCPGCVDHPMGWSQNLETGISGRECEIDPSPSKSDSLGPPRNHVGP